MKVVIVEDDEFSFEILEECLAQEHVTDIIRAHSYTEAVNIMYTVQESVLWIIDGQFPLNSTTHTTENLGPALVTIIRKVRSASETIFWHSASPELFKPIANLMAHVYWKQDFFVLAKEVGCHYHSYDPSFKKAG